MLQAEAWIGPYFKRERGTLITPMPLYHIFALTANCLLFVRLGWRNILIINPRDFPAFDQGDEEVPFSVHLRRQHAVQCLLNTPGFDTVDFSRAAR